jgi:predicted amidohydrolase
MADYKKGMQIDAQESTKYFNFSLCKKLNNNPFTFAGEDMVLNGRNEISAVKLSSMTEGLTICYDLRFPEIYSALGKQCDLIINITN